jgi:GNAT superfamily N-acetyltransferase
VSQTDPHIVVEPLTEPAAVEGLLGEYLRWGVERMAAANGVRLDDPEQVIEQYRRSFRRELPNLLGPRGRLLVARLGGAAVGVGALKPVDADTAEIKRMYVAPSARGRGIGRALMQRLLAEARAEGFRVARLETANFMTEAHALYRSLGFRERGAFDGAETAMTDGIERFIYFMELPLDAAGEGRGEVG